MALPRTFAFTGADGTDLVVYDSAFAYAGAGLNAIALTSNHVAGNGYSVENLAVVDAETFNNDQYAQGVVALALNARTKGVCARMSSLGSGYVWYGYGPSSYGGMLLVLEVLRVPTTLGSYGSSFLVNKIVRLECSGTTMTGLHDGVARVTVTDSTYASGKAGLAFQTAGGGSELDDLEVGNLAAAATPSDVIGITMNKRRFSNLLVR